MRATSKVTCGFCPPRPPLAILAAVALLFPPHSWSDTPTGMYDLFAGYNIYSPSVIYDEQTNEYKMWYGGWQTSQHFPNDRIYYRTSTDNLAWSAPTTVLTPAAVHQNATHVNDPSVSKILNTSTGQWQYTMFYTVCMNPCTYDPIDSQIWSSVSSDGIIWSFHQLLALGALGPETPSAAIDPQPDGTVWKVYYIDRYDHSRVKVMRVNGNRAAIATQVVMEDIGRHLANPEVRRIGAEWHLFYNVYGQNGFGSLSDIYRSGSGDNLSWQPGINILQGSAPYCGTLTPAARPRPVGSTEYDLYFALWTKSGTPPECYLPGGVEHIERWRMRLDGPPTP